MQTEHTLSQGGPAQNKDLVTVDTRQSNYRPDIEGLRAIAILLVVAAHAKLAFFPGGFIGVDIFFVLSGYLITALLFREIKVTGRVDFVDFYARRMRRLVPALFAMLIAVSLASVFLLGLREQLWNLQTAVFSATWTSNFYFAFSAQGYFDPSAENNAFLHTWSLGVEEQFYLFWPALLGAVFAKGINLRRGIAVISGVAIASFILCVISSTQHNLFAFFLPFGRGWQFALGALLFLFEEYCFGLPNFSTWKIQWRRFVMFGGILGLAAILGFSLLVAPGMLSYPGAWALIPSLGATLVLFSGRLCPDFLLTRLLALPPFERIGNLSYSWYLWHWPVFAIVYLKTGNIGPGISLVLVIFSFVLAALSHYLLERPIRYHAWVCAHSRAVLFATFVGMFLFFGAERIWNGVFQSWAAEPELHRYVSVRNDIPVIYGMGCDEWYHSARLKLCSFGRAKAPHTVVLVGDSIAGQWFPAIEKIYPEKDWQIIVATKSSCPMVDAPFYYARIGREFTECAAWRADVLAWLRKLRPDVVFMGSNAADFSDAQWISGTQSVLAGFASAAGQVFLLLPTPHLPFDGPDCLVLAAWRTHIGLPPQTCSVPAFDARVAAVHAALRHAAAGYVNVHPVDMTEAVCPDGRCLAERNGLITYRDAQHLAASYVERLAPALAEATTR